MMYFLLSIFLLIYYLKTQGSQTDSFSERLVAQTNQHYTFMIHPVFYYVSAAFITVTSTTAYLDKLHAEQASGLSCLLQVSCYQHRLTVTDML